jgi:hypothetical protein
MRLGLAAIAALLVPAAASAQSMNAETFHQKAIALQRKGMMAVFSKDLKVLVKEGQAAAEVVSGRRQAVLKAGGKPRYCPLPSSPRKMETKEFMARLGAIPRADRQRIDMTEAMNRILARKFPC